MTRASPPEFRRRVLAAVVSYQLSLRSVDYTLKQYVDEDLWSDEQSLHGDQVSDFIKQSTATLKRGLGDLHTQDENLALNIFGAEISLFTRGASSNSSGALCA
jgi:hypothetical protein